MTSKIAIETGQCGYCKPCLKGISLILILAFEIGWWGDLKASYVELLQTNKQTNCNPQDLVYNWGRVDFIAVK